MLNNNNVIKLQCTLVLGDYNACTVIGINPKHEIKVESRVTSLAFKYQCHDDVITKSMFKKFYINIAEV